MTKQDMVSLVNNLQNKLKIQQVKVEKYNKYLAQKNQAHKLYYKHKYTYNPQMGEDEKQIIKENKDKRNELAVIRYNRNLEQKEKQQKRSKKRYYDNLSPEKKAKYDKRKQIREAHRNSTNSIVSLDFPSNPSNTL